MNLTLTWLDRAEIVMVLASLVLLAFARQLERSAMAVSSIVILAAAAAFACGVQDADAVRLALVVVPVTLAVAALLLPTAELDDPQQVPEAGALLLVGAVGGVVLTTGRSLIEVALGVEMVSLSAAALVGLGRGTRALEGAFKYFILTALTFATLLFGMALVFLGSGSLDLPTLGAVAEGARPLVLGGIALMMIGLLFKLATAPVHFGALDAYTTGPAGFVGFVMVVSKLGAATALARLAGGTSGVPTSSIAFVLVLVGLVTIGVGVVASFAQTDFRRLLAYSAVGHAGFLALAAGSVSAGGDAAARYYVVGYGAAALLCFASLAGIGGDPFPLAALKKGSARPLGRLRAAALIIGLASLAGVPPLPGFWVKLAVLKASWGAWGLVPTTLAALGGVVGVIYYLRPVPDLLAQGRSSPAPEAGSARTSLAANLVVVALLVVVVVLGLWPAAAWMLAR